VLENEIVCDDVCYSRYLLIGCRDDQADCKPLLWSVGPFLVLLVETIGIAFIVKTFTCCHTVVWMNTQIKLCRRKVASRHSYDIFIHFWLFLPISLFLSSWTGIHVITLTRSIWKMLDPFATVSRLTPIHQVSLAVLSRAACASMSTTTTTRDIWDHYGPMEWAQ